MNIVQIGCNDCNDHVREYVKNNSGNIELLLLVDANQNKIKKCHDIYGPLNIDYNLIPKAITSGHEKELTLYFNRREVNGHHTSVNKDHLLRHNHSESMIESESVPAINLNKLFDEYNLKDIDRLYVDAEGYDIEILKSIDYSKYNIERIQFEYIHCDGAFSGMSQKVKDFIKELEDIGYNRVKAPSGEIILVLSKV